MNTTTLTAPEPELAQLWARAIGSDSARSEWLRLRRVGLTATDMKVIGRSRESTVRSHLRKKASGEDGTFKGNRATEWGNYRESAIIAEYEGAGFHRCGLLIPHPENPRHLSTPDIAGVSLEAEIEIVEVKTSEKDLHPSGPDFAATRYLEQMLWQAWTTGAARVILHVEQHDGDFTRWNLRPGEGWEFSNGTTLAEFGPRIIATHTYTFEMADYAAEIAELVQRADAALAILDEELVGFEASGPETFTEGEARQYGVEGRRYAAAIAAEKAAKIEKAEAQAEVIALAVEQNRRAFSERFDGVKITYAPEQVVAGAELVDLDAAKAADAALWAQVEQANENANAARLALAAVADQWAAHCEAFKKPGEPTTAAAKVTFTPPRGGTK